MKVKIREIFSSIQGEGPFIGYKQLFIRFCKCNLNCEYCDTDFNINQAQEYTTDDLIKLCQTYSDCHSVSLTGGEPLVDIEFLKDFLPKCPLPVYLETNGILYNNLQEIIEFVTYVSADIKLFSSTNQKTNWEEHEKFFEIANKKHLFAKVVFGKNITEEEINKTINLCKKYNIELVLQPLMKGKNFTINNDFMLEILNKFVRQYPKTRLIPQVHKYINVD